jgi:hypothetical protein
VLSHHQGLTKPRDYFSLGPIPLGVANGSRGKPEHLAKSLLKLGGPYLPSPRTSIGSVGGIPEEFGELRRLSRGPEVRPEVSGEATIGQG